MRSLKATSTRKPAEKHYIGTGRKAVFPGERVILPLPFEDTHAAAPRHTVGILTESLNDFAMAFRSVI